MREHRLDRIENTARTTHVLKLRKGVDQLLSCFDKAQVSDIVDLARADVCNKRCGVC